jgi:uncharacterized protein YdeI (YjbR/CyaY-like superfamily)
MIQKGERWQAECELVVSILQEFPELEVVQKWGADVYTIGGKNVVSYGGFKHFFSIWFYNGVFLQDTYSVLVNASEGKTKSLRQWRFKNAQEMNPQRIKEYIQEAILVEKKGLKIQAAKFQMEPLPNELVQALKFNGELEMSFHNLSPGKQKEYALFIKEAKQETTRLKRIQKIIPMILNGQGLNDKYKN